MFGNRRVKILTCFSEVSHCLENDSTEIRKLIHSFPLLILLILKLSSLCLTFIRALRPHSKRPIVFVLFYHSYSYK